MCQEAWTSYYYTATLLMLCNQSVSTLRRGRFLLPIQYIYIMPLPNYLRPGGCTHWSDCGAGSLPGDCDERTNSCKMKNKVTLVSGGRKLTTRRSSKASRKKTSKRTVKAPWRKNVFNFGGPSKRTDGTLQAVNGMMRILKLKWAKKPVFVTDDGKNGAWYAHADMTGLTPDMYTALIKTLNQKKIGYEIARSWRAQWGSPV